MFFLQASSISKCVKEKFLPHSRGEVWDVFSRALNIIGENGEFIGMSEPEAMNNPIALLVPESSACLPQCSPGMKVHFSGDSLRIDNALTVFFHRASVFDPLLRLQAPLLPFCVIRDRLRSISIFSFYGKGGVGDLIPYYERLTQGMLPQVKVSTWAEILAPHLAGLCTGLITGNIEEVRRLIYRIVGTGIGLTPSGDDVLIGLFGSLKVFLHENGMRDCHTKLFPDESWIKGTTPLSKALLMHSLRRELSEGLGNVLRGLLTEKAPLEDALKQLLSLGATSGEDTLLGVLLGVGVGLQLFDSN